MLDLSTLLDLAVDLATRAGAMLMDGFEARHETVGTKTSSTDMVTDLDRASEELIVEGLIRMRPDDGILGEEGASREGSSGIRWVIDPLDGTTNYLYGLPAFAVSIAAELHGAAVVGVVADPSHDEVFTATSGGGARRNGVPIAVSGATELATALVATGFGYRREQRSRQAQVLTEVLPAVRDVRRFGAAAIDLCWVACGRLDAYYEVGIQHWDVAAGGLVATEAGAHVEGLREVSTGSDSARVIAATPGLADPLRQLLDAAPPPT
ncbi:MAG TPA: inositol monophosphatase family protein [Acidimicrobiales bacterium]|nr:inositol monophosphatase family protein [Acidimicrobiales bacterium]